MANKRFFGRILALALVFGLVLVGCPAEGDNNGGGGDGGNPFVGTWRSPDGGGFYVLVFTEGSWTITSPTGNVESGIYTWTLGQTSIQMIMTSGGNGTFNVSISGSSLSFGSRTYTRS